MSMLSKIPTDISPDELSHLLDIHIDPCPCCEQAFIYDEAHWLYGEREHGDGDWSETIAFGCPRCNATGPASLTRLEAMWGWNVLVGASEHMKYLYKNL